MGQVHWSEPALEDLGEIVSFVARDSCPLSSPCVVLLDPDALPEDGVG